VTPVTITVIIFDDSGDAILDLCGVSQDRPQEGAPYIPFLKSQGFGVEILPLSEIIIISKSNFYRPPVQGL
jgi:hypothetical protein